MKYSRAAMLLSIAATSLAHAQSAGQWVVNAGWMHLAPQDSSQPLTVNALGQSTVVPGSGSTLANANTFALTTRYFVTDHVALETVLGVPPKLHLSGTGSLAPVGELGTARAWSPAAQVQNARPIRTLQRKRSSSPREPHTSVMVSPWSTRMPEMATNPVAPGS